MKRDYEDNHSTDNNNDDNNNNNNNNNERDKDDRCKKRKTEQQDFLLSSSNNNSSIVNNTTNTISALHSNICNIHIICTDIWLYILRNFMSPFEVCTFSGVCKRFHYIATDEEVSSKGSLFFKLLITYLLYYTRCGNYFMKESLCTWMCLNVHFYRHLYQQQ